MIFCGSILLAQGKKLEIMVTLRNKKELRKLLWAGMLITINWGSYIIAVTTGHILDGSLAYYMNPLFSVMIGFFIYQEKLHWLQWLAVGMAFIGIMISALSYGKVPYYALTMAMTFAVYGAIKKKCSDHGSHVYFY